MLTEERLTRFLSGGEFSLLGSWPCCYDRRLRHQNNEHDTEKWTTSSPGEVLLRLTTRG